MWSRAPAPSDTPKLPVDGHEEGAVLVTVTLAFVVLLTVSALAIDVGLAMVARRAAQNAADHAALAAAWAECHGEDPTAAAQSSVTRNGHEVVELSVTEPTAGEYVTRVTRDVALSFAPLIGLNTLTVNGEASATCQGSGGSSNTLFALGDSCASYGKDQIDISGSQENIYGGVHSNGNIRVGGSDNDFGPGDPGEDPFTYVDTFDNGGSGNGFDSGYPKSTSTQPTPLEFELDDYRPGSGNAVAAGPDYFYVDGDIDGSFVESQGDGLYYSTGDIKLDKEITATVTLVAEGVIEVSASDQDLEPYVDGLLAFAAEPYTGIDRCDKFVVNMGGSSNSWSGVIYGPKGLIEMNGSSNTTLTGSLIGYSLRLNGSELTIRSDGAHAPTQYDVKLLK
ncbi:MAG: pilus assembly protein TadG-related protein [Acidimicrobiia bacterium]|nr:pilus assembly protein TadG-related protein [Acidimicrobiia bacterium]